MIRISVLILAVLAPFMFPWPLTFLLIVLAAFTVPAAGLAVGILTDALYQTAHSFPLATCVGLASLVVALLVRQFVKTRIIVR